MLASVRLEPIHKKKVEKIEAVVAFTSAQQAPYFQNRIQLNLLKLEGAL